MAVGVSIVALNPPPQPKKKEKKGVRALESWLHLFSVGSLTQINVKFAEGTGSLDKEVDIVVVL